MIFGFSYTILTAFVFINMLKQVNHYLVVFTYTIQVMMFSAD